VRRRRRGKCWDEVVAVVDVFFNNHVRLRRELRLKLVDAMVALELGDIEKAERVINELLLLLDL
jgi:hypothetical protein